MRLLYVVDNSFYDFKPQKPSLVTIRSIVIEHTLRGNVACVQRSYLQSPQDDLSRWWSELMDLCVALRTLFSSCLSGLKQRHVARTEVC